MKDFMLAHLLHTSAVIVDENNTSGYLDNATNFKTMVTGDVLQINRKYHDPVDYRFSGMIVQCINSLPRVSDKSSSFYRRLLMIPFDKCFTGSERKYIKNQYLARKDVLEYVLYRVLYLMPSYYKFDIPDACDELLNQYKISNDPVRDFVNEMLDELTWDLVPNAFLYDLYKEWYKDTNPSGRVQGKLAFLSDLKHIIQESKDWEVKSSSIPTKGYTFDTEPLILKYDLKRWMHPNYQGTDPNVICHAPIPSSVAGIRRIATAFVSVEEEEKPFSQERKDDDEKRI